MNKADNQQEEEKNLIEEKYNNQESEGGENVDLKKLIEKNIRWSQIIYQQNKKIKNRLTFMLLGSYLKFLLILAPIIIAIFYLPPFINKIIKTYGSLLPTQYQGQSGIVEELNKLLMTNNISTQSFKANQK